MSVVGFDIGNDSCVVAAVRQRGVDVLLNDESSRETPSLISFTDKQRLIGGAAASSASMNPLSTVSQIKRLFLPPYSHLIHSDLQRLPFQTSESSSGGVLIHLRGRVFTPTQLLAMLFSHLKIQAEKSLNSPISDCVIGIPSYFTDLQRRAYLDAAAIAGLRPLRLFHDTAAIALSYGIYRTEGPSNVVFVDIGHCDTQVAVVSFGPGHMRVLAHSFDPSLGGREFDELLFDHFANQFKSEYNIDVYSNVKARIRLMNACEKLKKVLSANPQAPINIECLMDEKDVKGFIKREEFEKLSSGLLERVLVPCRKALQDAGLSLDKIHSVELVGSGSRIPSIVKVLGGFFEREPSRTLNASECVARGCALQCAMLSPVFKVREYEVQDSFPFSIGFSCDEGPTSMQSKNILFQKGQSLPSSKILTFHRSSTFHLEAFYADPSELPPGASQKISSFTVGPFQASDSQKHKVKVRITLNLHGIVTVDSASLIDDAAADQASQASQTSSDNGYSAHPPKVRYVPDANSDDNGVPEQFEYGSMAGVTEMGEGRPSRLLLPVSETIYGGMTKDELLEAHEQEKQLAYQDKLIEQTKERKNALESYVYEIRNKLFERYRSFATESEREGISKSLQDTEEWLYDDGDDETEDVYTGKLDELKQLVDPIEKRFKDEEARAQATRELLNCIVDHRMAVKSLAAYERDAVINECNKAEQWLREKTQQQDSLPKNADPLLWSDDVKKMTESLQITCKDIMRRCNSPSRSEDSKDPDHLNTPDGMQTD